MFSALLTGTVFGLSAGFAPGPLLMLVLTQTFRHNAREGARVAMAPLLTDVPIVMLSLFLLERLARLEGLLGWIGLFGSLYVCCLAVETFRTAPVSEASSTEEPASLAKGAIINALSPHPWLFWATVGGPFVLKAGAENPAAPWAFIATFYIFLVGSKVFIAYGAGRLRGFLSGKGYRNVLRILGLLLAVFGVLLFRDAAASLGWFI